MKFKKFIIPIIAAFAIMGMSFANANDEITVTPVANDYVYNNGSWEAIPEQNCPPGNKTCRVQFGEGGPIFDVYDEMDLGTKKDSESDEPIIL